MEEDNNNIIVKGLTIILIAILGLNVYRTEMTKKEMAQLATTVEQLSAKLDSLGVFESPSGTTPSSSGVSKKEFARLSKTVSSLESRVTSIQGAVDRLSRGQAQSTEATKASSSPATATGKTSKSGRVLVTAKVKVENRYVNGMTYLPKVSTGPEGVVIIDVTMTRVGTVTAVSVNGNSTISDEEILDACKEAALKTDFGYNPDAPEKSRGTITYSFTIK